MSIIRGLFGIEIGDTLVINNDSEALTKSLLNINKTDKKTEKIPNLDNLPRNDFDQFI